MYYSSTLLSSNCITVQLCYHPIVLQFNCVVIQFVLPFNSVAIQLYYRLCFFDVLQISHIDSAQNTVTVVPHLAVDSNKTDDDVIVIDLTTSPVPTTSQVSPFRLASPGLPLPQASITSPQRARLTLGSSSHLHSPTITTCRLNMSSPRLRANLSTSHKPQMPSSLITDKTKPRMSYLAISDKTKPHASGTLITDKTKPQASCTLTTDKTRPQASYSLTTVKTRPQASFSLITDKTHFTPTGRVGRPRLSLPRQHLVEYRPRNPLARLSRPRLHLKPRGQQPLQSSHSSVRTVRLVNAREQIGTTPLASGIAQGIPTDHQVYSNSSQFGVRTEESGRAETDLNASVRPTHSAPSLAN